MLRALPLALALAAFAVGLRGGFVLDDLPTIVDNPVVTGAAPLASAFSTDAWGRKNGLPSYRPLATLFYRGERALFGASPFAFHLVALALYLAAIALGQALAAAWLGERGACLAMCLFATLPVHVEAVASVVGTSESAALVCELVALALLLPATRGEPLAPSRMGGAALAFGAALLWKESAVMFPFVVALLVGRRQIATLALAAVLLAYLALRLRVVGLARVEVGDDLLAAASSLARAAIALEIAFGYARLLALPIDLCTGRKYAELALPDARSLPAILAGAALLAAIGWLTARDLRRGRRPFLACAAVLGFVFSSLPIHLPELMADRFLYGPSWFVCLWLAGAATEWLWRDRIRRALVALAIALEGAACVFYCRAWRDELALFTHAVAACPRSVHDRLRLAEALARRGDAAEAVWQFAVAAEGRRRFPRRFDPPDDDAPIGERLAHLHALLRASAPEPAWRAGLARYLDERGFRAEAAIVRQTPPDFERDKPATAE